MSEEAKTDLIQQLEAEEAKIVSILNVSVMPIAKLSQLNNRQREIRAQLKVLKQKDK